MTTKSKKFHEDLNISGALTLGTALAVLQGGTGATSASTARTNLGLVIGTDVAAIATPTFTGTPAAPTAAQGTNTTQIATTAMVHSETVLLATLASPTFTGLVTGPQWKSTGVTGANNGSLTISGSNTSGAPASGAHVKGEITGDDTGKLYYCTVAGTPGTWVAIGGSGGSVATDTLFTTKGDLAVGTGTSTAARLAVGSNGQQLTADSTQTTGAKWTAAGGPTRYLDIPAGAWVPRTTNGATPASIETATNLNNYQVMDFADGATVFSVDYSLRMPGNWDASTFTFTPYWQVNSTSTNPVVWQCSARAYGDATTIDQAMGTAQTSTDSGSGTANQLQIAPVSAAITAAGSPAAGQWLHLRVFRDPANAGDTLAATARLIGVTITYGVV